MPASWEARGPMGKRATTGGGEVGAGRDATSSRERTRTIPSPTVDDSFPNPDVFLSAMMSLMAAFHVAAVTFSPSTIPRSLINMGWCCPPEGGRRPQRLRRERITDDGRISQW
eukprot:1567540-Pyramimonas_sp.AAC.1